MDLISKEKAAELASFHAPHCITIYMPTHKAGINVNEGLDLVNFKNQIKEVKKQLNNYRLSEAEIKNSMLPLKGLLEDVTFWHNLSNGLVVFLGKDFFEYYTAPLAFNELVYVSDHFYLKPLLALFAENENYFILTLSQHGVRLFVANQYTINEKDIEERVPGRLEEVVGYDFEEPFHDRNSKLSGSMGKRGMFKGHGEGENENKEKKEIFQFFNEVDNGLKEVFLNQTVPLVVATDIHLFPVFQQACNYKNLCKEFISGPENKDIHQMHSESWKIAQKYINKHREDKALQYNESVGKTSYLLKDIIPAAINGRVDTLFLQPGAMRWGQYDKETNGVIEQEEKTVNNACLLNMAAVHTFLNGGTVYLRQADQMPAINSIINAIFRY